MSKNYRFKQIQLRAFNKDLKKMIYSDDPAVIFILNSKGFVTAKVTEDGGIGEPLAQDENSVLMQGAGHKDYKNNPIYEGDVVFTRRPTKRGLFPIIGIVNSKDFTFTVNSGINHYVLAYEDKDTEILGNIFEHSDEELAKKGEELMAKYTPPKK